MECACPLQGLHLGKSIRTYVLGDVCEMEVGVWCEEWWGYLCFCFQEKEKLGARLKDSVKMGYIVVSARRGIHR